MLNASTGLALSESYAEKKHREIGLRGIRYIHPSIQDSESGRIQ